MDRFEALEKEMCKELETIEQKMKSGTEMSETDLKRVDMLTHAMKSLATYKAMKESEEYGPDYYGGYSGRMSRFGRGTSYSDGYSRGYSEAMSRMRY
jgi:hypothetical protein